MVAAQAGMVFVVEDDEGMRSAIERLVQVSGLGCTTFGSAEELLALPDVSPTCIVSDLKLPGISGLELLEKLKARGATAPLVLITAHDSPDLHAEAIRRGAAAYLAKPFRGTALLDAIHTAVER